MFNTRLQKLQQGLDKSQVAALLVSTPANIRYLTGFVGTSETEREAWLLVTVDETFFFTDARYFKNDSSFMLHDSNFMTRLLDSENKLASQIGAILEQKKINKLAFEQDDLVYSEWDKMKKVLSKIELSAIPSPVSDLRKIKDNKEIRILKKACLLTDQFLEKFTPMIVPGKTEQELAWKLESMVRSAGYELSFPPIIAVDRNSAIPHHNSQAEGKTKVKENSLVLVDFGVKYQGYCADMTRMFFVGQPPARVLAMYKALLEIQKQTIAIAIAETAAAKVDLFARNLISKILNLPLPHAIGHGVGLEIHESPMISPNSKDMLLPGMVITIEPGIYIKNEFGMRLEDTVLIGKDGKPEILTKFKK